MEKLQYLHNRLTDFDKIWQGDAYGTTAAGQLLTLTEFENARWPPVAILKMEKS